MKTIELSHEEMEERISRFASLQPLPVQKNPNIPQEAKDILYARKLLSVIGLEDDAETPISSGAPIKGAAGATMTIAVCPSGQGPTLHAHQNTYETFTVLQGRFEISWNDDGEHGVVLDRFDTISVPPRVCRSFKNVSEEEGILQVIITGGIHDMTDIGMPPAVADRLDAVKPGLSKEFENMGLTFTAGKEQAA